MGTSELLRYTENNIVLLVILVLTILFLVVNFRNIRKWIYYRNKTKDGRVKIQKAMRDLEDEHRNLIIELENQLNTDIVSSIEKLKDNERKSVDSVKSGNSNVKQDPNGAEVSRKQTGIVNSPVSLQGRSNQGE